MRERETEVKSYVSNRDVLSISQLRGSYRSGVLHEKTQAYKTFRCNALWVV